MNQPKELLKIIWFPLSILAVFIIVFIAVGGNLIKEVLIGSFGGALVGVILGFIAEMIREGFKEFQVKLRDRKIYLRLLEEDAKSAHHTIWLYTRLINDTRVPQEVKNQIPVDFDLRYWSQLSRDSNFLRFGSEAPFDKIFRIMWNLEKVNEQIFKARTKDPQAFQFAHAFYNMTIEDKQTNKLLKCFMSKEEIEELETNWLRTAQERVKEQ